MHITLVFFFGFLAAVIAVLPPGLLNMTAAKISLKEGRTRGVVFSLGACLIVLVQAAVAFLLARYLSKHIEVIKILRLVALSIFILITIYFLFLAKTTPKKQEKIKIKSKRSRFYQGVFLSSINMFPIPFQAYISITLASFGLMVLDYIDMTPYVLGVGLGTLAVLYLYILFFDKIKERTFTSQKNMNYIIGGITGIISLMTIIKIVNEAYA